MQIYIEQIRQFVNESFLFGQGIGELSDDDSFLEKGIIDSTGVLELVGFIQEKYDLRLEDEELVPENLDSINRVAAFVHMKLAAAPGAPALCSS
jgi:acyl carrier protein